jgi:excisionase family DNA binding protein
MAASEQNPGPDASRESDPGDSLQHKEQSKEKKPEYLTAQQLAEVLQISEATIHRLRRTGRIPAVMLTERLIRFNLRDVQRALKPHRANPDGSDETQDDGPSPQLSFRQFDSSFEIE